MRLMAKVHWMTISAGLSGQFDRLASKITEDDWVFLTDEGGRVTQ